MESIIRKLLGTASVLRSEGRLLCRNLDLSLSKEALVVQNPPANAGDTSRRVFESWVGKTPWSRKWQSTPVFLPGNFHGQKSLVGYSSQGRKEEPGGLQFIGSKRLGHD